jgi:hypothetical protein
MLAKVSVILGRARHAGLPFNLAAAIYRLRGTGCQAGASRDRTLRQIDEFCGKKVGLIWEILSLDSMMLMLADSGSANDPSAVGSGKQLLLVWR